MAQSALPLLLALLLVVLLPDALLGGLGRGGGHEGDTWRRGFAHADFRYSSFNTTATRVVGLHLLGAASLEQCTSELDDDFDGIVLSQNVRTTAVETVTVTQHDVVQDCVAALRLTPSRPDLVGAAWHATRQAVVMGFETGFKFRIANRSRECRTVVQRNDAKVTMYDICGGPGDQNVFGGFVQTQVSGGDGFAFVVQSSPDGRAAQGSTGGGGLGYTGLANSLAVEFDTFSNGEFGEPFVEHISVHSAGSGDNEATSTRALIEPLPVTLGDTAWHDVRITYNTSLRLDLLDAGYFRATSALGDVLGDGVGTLCVHLDDLVTPAFCLPLSLQALLTLRGGSAWVGFTASTGQAWQSHDISEWYFCEAIGCPV